MDAQRLGFGRSFVSFRLRLWPRRRLWSRPAPPVGIGTSQNPASRQEPEPETWHAHVDVGSRILPKSSGIAVGPNSVKFGRIRGCSMPFGRRIGSGSGALNEQRSVVLSASPLPGARRREPLSDHLADSRGTPGVPAFGFCMAGFPQLGGSGALGDVRPGPRRRESNCRWQHGPRAWIESCAARRGALVVSSPAVLRGGPIRRPSAAGTKYEARGHHEVRPRTGVI